MKYQEIGTKNLRHAWSILCTSSTLDQETNNLSLNNLIEQLNVNIGKEDAKKKSEDGSQGYMIPVQLEVITRVIKRDPQMNLAFEIKIDLLDPSNKVLASHSPGTIGLKNGVKNMRIRSRLPGFPVTAPGTYTLSVQLKEAGESEYTEVDRLPLDVSLDEVA